jgi:hypothetical protein
MRIRAWWGALVEQAQRLVPDSRPGSNARRVHLTWQTCRRCRSRSYLPAGGDRLCGSCRSLQ